MTSKTAQPQTAALHPAATIYAEDYRQGLLSRREFLTRTTALGVATPLAFGLIGLEAPAPPRKARWRAALCG